MVYAVIDTNVIVACMPYYKVSFVGSFLNTEYTECFVDTKAVYGILLRTIQPL